MNTNDTTVRFMDAKIHACTFVDCTQKFDKMEIGALVFWQERETDRPHHWNFGGTRCMSCVFDFHFDTEKYRSEWYYITREYANTLGLEASDITVNEYTLEELNKEARDEGYIDYNDKKTGGKEKRYGER